MRYAPSFLLLLCMFGHTAARSQVDDALLETLVLPQEYEARRESSSNEDLHRNGDAEPINPGETLVLGELQGPGIITHIWNTVGTPDPFYGRSLVLRIYYDGNEHPSVQAPLGDFFGVGHGAYADYTSAVSAVSSQGRARNCYWKMPFQRSAKVTVTNESKDYKIDSFYYYLDWRKYDSLPSDIQYFHAEYRQDFPAKPGDYTILETTGKGHYVGTVQSVHQMEIGWFGEGDDRFYIDGESEPSLRGTGTEDYFNDAWGYREFATPYYGVSLFEGYFPGDRVTTYRWHIPDPIPFERSLKVTIEHKGSIFTDTTEFLGQFIEREDWVSTVAYWYQDEPREITEPIARLGDRLAPYRILEMTGLNVKASPDRGLTKERTGLSYMPMNPNARVDIEFVISEAGRYQINAFLMHAFYGSVYQPLLNNEPLGPPIDLNYSGADPIWHNFDLHKLSPGKHTLSFVGKGKSPHQRSAAPTVYGIGVSNLILLRMEDMPGYQASMERTLDERN